MARALKLYIADGGFAWLIEGSMAAIGAASAPAATVRWIARPREGRPESVHAARATAGAVVYPPKSRVFSGGKRAGNSSVPTPPTSIGPSSRAGEKLNWIIHAAHGQNCHTPIAFRRINRFIMWPAVVCCKVNNTTARVLDQNCII